MSASDAASDELADTISTRANRRQPLYQGKPDYATLEAVSYWRGFCSALLLVELVAFAWLVRTVPTLQAMFADLGASPQPSAFKVVASSWYPWVCFVGLLSAAVAAERVPRRDVMRVVALVVVVAVAGGVVAFTYNGLYSPVNTLSGRIR